MENTCFSDRIVKPAVFLRHAIMQSKKVFNFLIIVRVQRVYAILMFLRSKKILAIIIL